MSEAPHFALREPCRGPELIMMLKDGETHFMIMPDDITIKLSDLVDVIRYVAERKGE